MHAAGSLASAFGPIEVGTLTLELGSSSRPTAAATATSWEARRIVEAFTVDDFSFDVGNNWDAPSYIPIARYDDAQWAPMCGEVKQATHLTLGRTATTADVIAAGADVVVVAIGSRPRVPTIPGIELSHVHTAVATLRGEADLGRRVLVIAEDDGPAPLSVSDHLAGLGHHATVGFQIPGPAPLVGKYSNGGMLARLVDDGARFVPMARVVAIEVGSVELASTYGTRGWSVVDVDSVVLATGSIPSDELYRSLRHRHDEMHLLGDAFAPRRMVFATRQAFELARSLR